MSLYIHPDNQEILWRVINSNPYISQVFSNLHPSHKNEWFKSTIEKIYDKISNKNISTLELHELNKETISYMVQTVQNSSSIDKQPAQQQQQQQQSQQSYQPQQYMSQQSPQQQPQQQQQQQPQQQQQQYPPQQQQQQQQPQYQQQYPSQRQQQPQQQQKPYTFQQPSQSVPQYSSTNQEFAQKVNQYEQNYKTMLDKKEPEPVDFKEKFEDTAISNMDELIEKHRKERELEMNTFAATSALVIPPSSSVARIQDAAPYPQPIQQSYLPPPPAAAAPPPNIQYQIEASPPPQQQQQLQIENVVTEKSAESDMTILKNKIDDLQQQIDTVMFSIEDKLNLLIQQFMNIPLQDTSSSAADGDDVSGEVIVEDVENMEADETN